MDSRAGSSLQLFRRPSKQQTPHPPECRILSTRLYRQTDFLNMALDLSVTMTHARERQQRTNSQLSMHSNSSQTRDSTLHARLGVLYSTDVHFFYM